jgi:hypothetical protein
VCRVRPCDHPSAPQRRQDFRASPFRALSHSVISRTTLAEQRQGFDAQGKVPTKRRNVKGATKCRTTLTVTRITLDGDCRLRVKSATACLSVIGLELPQGGDRLAPAALFPARFFIEETLPDPDVGR